MVDFQLLYTIEEARKLLKVNKGKVYELIQKGYIKALKLGSFKIRREELERFIKECEGLDMTDLDNVKPLGTKN